MSRVIIFTNKHYTVFTNERTDIIPNEPIWRIMISPQITQKYSMSPVYYDPTNHDYNISHPENIYKPSGFKYLPYHCDILCPM